MSLINCPECGKENVSDSANACPDCGYDIKTHFDKIHQEEVQKQQLLKTEQDRQQAELDKKKREQERIKSVPQPVKPVFSKGLISYSIIATIILSWLFLYLPTTYYEDINVGTWFFEISTFVGAPLCIYKYRFNKRLSDYKLAKIDFESYQRQVVREQDKAINNAKRQADTRARELASRAKCPYCDSQNTTKITATAKVVNTAMFGIFGQKRKHQWHCINCNSDF